MKLPPRFIIIDANVLACVFDPTNKLHVEFSPVKEGVERRRLTIAFGGTRYLKEIKKMPNYLRLIGQFKTANKAKSFDGQEIDQQEQRIIRATSDSKFDDQHIIAIQVVSKAPVICSLDKQAHPFFKNKNLYPKKHPLPLIYTCKKNAKACLG